MKCFLSSLYGSELLLSLEDTWLGPGVGDEVKQDESQTYYGHISC